MPLVRAVGPLNSGWSRRSSWILFLGLRPEIDVDDITDSFDVHVLPHHLSADVDRYDVIARVDQIPDPATAKEAATTLAAGTGCRRTESGCFCRPQVDLAGSA